MHEAVPNESLEMTVDSRLRRSELAREVRDADGLSRTRESFQQAQRQVDGLGCRTFDLEPQPGSTLRCDLGHVSSNETLFQNVNEGLRVCQISAPKRSDGRTRPEKKWSADSTSGEGCRDTSPATRSGENAWPARAKRSAGHPLQNNTSGAYAGRCRFR